MKVVSTDEMVNDVYVMRNYIEVVILFMIKYQ